MWRRVYGDPTWCGLMLRTRAAGWRSPSGVCRAALTHCRYRTWRPGRIVFLHCYPRLPSAREFGLTTVTASSIHTHMFPLITQCYYRRCVGLCGGGRDLHVGMGSGHPYSGNGDMAEQTTSYGVDSILRQGARFLHGTRSYFRYLSTVHDATAVDQRRALGRTKGLRLI